jgi:hypothetical protein
LMIAPTRKTSTMSTSSARTSSSSPELTGAGKVMWLLELSGWQLTNWQPSWTT